MKKIFFSTLCSLLFVLTAHAQVGIGTNTPNAKAALDIQATNKGVLFPRLTNAQRDAIVDPPDGLHIYNTDERCLNYYDGVFKVWNTYCDNENKVIMIRITADVNGIDFYNAYAKNYPNAKKFILLIDPGVTVSAGVLVLVDPFGGLTIATAISFNGMPNGTSVKIINYGNIYGNGGGGGNGSTGQAGAACNYAASNGSNGGPAITAVATAVAGVIIEVNNYGIVAGGGGGGGGGGRNSLGEYGGGGGGGTGAPGGIGSFGGGTTQLFCLFSNCSCSTTSIAQSGTNGTANTSGTGGAGANNGGNGGNGGGLGQAGQNGTGTNAGLGGLPGYAVLSIPGPSGIIINNLNGGQVIGVVQ